jgi:hypothetical protein
MLDDLDELISALATHARPPRQLFTHGDRVNPIGRPLGEMHCPECGGVRRVNVVLRSLPDQLRGEVLSSASQATPGLLLYVCTQCDNLWTVTIFAGPDGAAMSAISRGRGGLTTPHTPASVAYYLDQASRAQSMGANSAALAMYRAALDHIMFERGYTTGMLGSRIQKVSDEVTAGTAPEWARGLDPEELKLMKDLGNESVHTNDGEVAQQAHLDGNLLIRVGQLFQLLIADIYEIPLARAARKQALKDTLNAMQTP